MPSTLVLVEGTDGTGKSQFIRSLSQQFVQNDNETNIRILAFPTTKMPIRVRQSVTSRILFFLNDFDSTFHDLTCFSDDYIICDRSFLSTLVYQGFRGDYSLVKGRFYNTILTVGENTFFGHINVDVVHTVLLTCSPDTAQKRIGHRDADNDEIDKLTGHEQKARLEALASRYQIVHSHLKQRWNNTNLFRPDPVRQTEPRFYEMATDNKTSEELAQHFIDSAIRD